VTPRLSGHAQVNTQTVLSISIVSKPDAQVLFDLENLHPVNLSVTKANDEVSKLILK
jgi:hypothetical protein